MNVIDIYQKYRIPPNLQEHMFRVTAAAHIIADNWTGESFNKDLLIKSCLLHDMGNIVKFKWDHALAIMGDEAANIEQWKQVQKEVIEKYGADEHEATQKMVDELNLTENVFEVMGHSLFVELEKILTYGPETKIFEYCDYRVGPYGVISLQKRLDDLYARYQHHKTVKDDTQWNRSVEVARELEKYVAASITISVNDIDDASVSPYLIKLQNYKIT